MTKSKTTLGDFLLKENSQALSRFVSLSENYDIFSVMFDTRF